MVLSCKWTGTESVYRIAMYDNTWFYIVNGVLASDYTGNVIYDGAVFYVENGMLR